MSEESPTRARLRRRAAKPADAPEPETAEHDAPGPEPRGDAPKEGRAADPQAFALLGAMQERLRAARKTGLIAVVDVGSTKIAALLARIDPRQNGYGAVSIIGAGVHRSRGVRLGAISDMTQTERAIRSAMNQAERDCSEQAFHTVANLTGAYPRSHAVSGEAPISGGRVDMKDMRRALAACRLNQEGDARSVLHAIAVNWSVDGDTGVRDPKGMAGRRLGVDLHMLTVAESAARNMAHCLAGADLELAALAATPYASGLACLVEEELEDGAACIDLGGGVTSASLFLKGEMVFADIVRMGGEQITLDIVRQLGLPRAEAERLKTLEGSAAVLSGAAKEPINLSPKQAQYFDSVGPTRADLSAAIRPRVEEILELARDRLAQAGFFYLPSRRVVLTGGGAQLEGIVDAAQAVFGPQVRVGRPIRLSGLPAPFSGPAFSAVAGLAGFAARPQDGLWERMVVNEKPTESRWGGLFRWLRETW